MSAHRRQAKRRVLVVTGSRAEFGLLKPVMAAVRKRGRLKLLVAVAGEHLLRPALTWREVAAQFRIDARVPMQRQRDRGRVDHAAACGRGMAGFAAAYRRLKPDWVVVLGDRIEAFAAASAASIAGIAVCHIHGGDRAEGIADEAMRHAITKMAHLHCAATEISAQRIRMMGERPEHVFATGSPAIDGLRRVKPMGDRAARRLGDPRAVVVMHPAGRSASEEEWWAGNAAVSARELVAPPGRLLDRSRAFEHVLLIAPNSDPGHEAIRAAWDFFASVGARLVEHLPRAEFLTLLARLRDKPGVLVGNSSAALIEAAALRVPALNLGPRQSGREHAGNLVDLPLQDPEAGRALGRMRDLMAHGVPRGHPFGDGRAGPRIAALLARVDPHDPALLRKRNSY